MINQLNLTGRNGLHQRATVTNRRTTLAGHCYQQTNYFLLQRVTISNRRTTLAGHCYQQTDYISGPLLPTDKLLSTLAGHYFQQTDYISGPLLLIDALRLIKKFTYSIMIIIIIFALFKTKINHPTTNFQFYANYSEKQLTGYYRQSQYENS